MDDFNRCFKNGSQWCDHSLRQEKADVGAYHAWLAGPASKAPFSTLVILHNLVSASVGESFVRGGQRKFACARDAAKALRGLLGFDFDAEVPLPPAGPLPGVGKHHLIDCS